MPAPSASFPASSWWRRWSRRRIASTPSATSSAIAHRFTDLDSAIAWGEFDAAANVTPDAVHHPTTMKLIAAGKHILCEKPLATTYPLALEMTEAAEKRGVINMVNLTYRGSPAVEKAREIVVSGEIGEIRHFEASYLQSWLVGNHWGDWKSEDRWLWRLSSATRQPRRHRRHRHPHRRLRHLCLRQRHRVDGKPRQDLPQGRRRAHRRLCAGRQRFLRHVGGTGERRARRHPCHALGHRLCQYAAPRPVRQPRAACR